ncbi:MAG: hypothetical protein K0V04_08015 [Deltaproteobacteria bacterium]|nr:hypothetical protein [Deltaproteobacteria bacterium]
MDWTMAVSLGIALACASCSARGIGEAGPSGTTDLPPSAGTTGGGSVGTTTDSNTTVADSSSAESSAGLPGTDDTGPGRLGRCGREQVIPLPPVDCTGVDGVFVGDIGIGVGGDDPAILEGIARVEGGIDIFDSTVVDVNFMACVREVTGRVVFLGNAELVDVGGLWSLETIGTDFIFAENESLVVFDGLPNLAMVNDDIVFHDNESLEVIAGLQSLVHIEGDLTIQGNPVLTSIEGIAGLMVIHGVLAVTANPLLCADAISCVTESIVDPPTPPPDWPDYPDC